MGLCGSFFGELMLEQQLASLYDETCWDLRVARSRFSGLGPRLFLTKEALVGVGVATLDAQNLLGVISYHSF